MASGKLAARSVERAVQMSRVCDRLFRNETKTVSPPVAMLAGQHSQTLSPGTVALTCAGAVQVSPRSLERAMR